MEKHYLTTSERELQERGLLDEKRVYERLDTEALKKAIWAVKTPIERIFFNPLFKEIFGVAPHWKAAEDDYCGNRKPAESCSPRTLKLLKRIEEKLDLNAYVMEGSYRERIAAVTQTRDGRTLNIIFTLD